MRKLFFVVSVMVLLSGCAGFGNGIIKSKPDLAGIGVDRSSYDDVVRAFGQPAMARIGRGEMLLQYLYRMPGGGKVSREPGKGYKYLAGCPECGELSFTFRPGAKPGKFTLAGIAMSDAGLDEQVAQGLALLQAGSYQQAYPLVLQAAEGHASEAQYNLGLMYIYGHGVEQDYARARDWLVKAAATDHPGALYDLGAMYMNAEGVELDPLKVLGLYERSASLGFAPAMGELVRLYGLMGEEERKAHWAARLEALPQSD